MQGTVRAGDQQHIPSSSSSCHDTTAALLSCECSTTEGIMWRLESHVLENDTHARILEVCTREG